MLAPLDARRGSVPSRDGIGGFGPEGGGGGARLFGTAGGSSPTLGDISVSSVVVAETVGELCELLLLRTHLENALPPPSSVGVSGLENDAYVGAGCTAVTGEGETAR